MARFKKISQTILFYLSSLDVIKDSNGSFLFSKEDKLRRFAEHYELLASDIISHSLNKEFWEDKLGFPPPDSSEWNISGSITISEIYKTVSSLKNKKAPDPDGIPSEFFKAFFCEYSSNNNQPNCNDIKNRYGY